MKSKILGAVAAFVLALTVGQARATTYNVLGNFADGALLTGSISLDPSNGVLSSLDLHGNNVMPGDTAVNWVGGVMSCGASDPTCGLPMYSYYISPAFYPLTETFDASTHSYSFFIYADGRLAELLLNFTLNALGDGGVITGGRVWDLACGGPCTFTVNGVTYGYGSGVNLIGGTLSIVPIPGTLPLFATGLGALGLLGWRRKRKNAAAVAAA